MSELTRRHLIVLAVTTALTAPAFAQDTLKLGLVAAMSGQSAKSGEAIVRGLSIAIAPEGTRMPTPRLGRFKKGAFHIAMAAGVPIVPLVFRNALDALPKHGVVLRPAQVDVVVHPPISTAGWRHEDLDRHVAETEALYAETLGG